MREDIDKDECLWRAGRGKGSEGKVYMVEDEKVRRYLQRMLPIPV